MQALHLQGLLRTCDWYCILLGIHEQRLDLLLLPELDCNMSKLVYAFRRVPS